MNFSSYVFSEQQLEGSHHDLHMGERLLILDGQNIMAFYKIRMPRKRKYLIFEIYIKHVT